MKKIIYLIILVLCINSVVFATEIEEEEPIIDNKIKQSVMYRAMKNSLYSKWGWSQEDVVSQYLANNSGFKKELNVQMTMDAATINNIEYGNIIGVCEIDLKQLDKYVLENTLEQNIDKIIKIKNEFYIEMKCRDVTLAYMNINQDERISHFISPGIFKSEYIKSLLPETVYIEPMMYLIEENDYVNGIYVKVNDTNSIITYEKFDSIDNEQFSITNTIETLKKVDDAYIIDNPRIDYELLEQQKQEEIQQLVEDGKQRDIVLYSISGGLAVVVAVVVIVFIRLMRRV